MSTDLIVFGEDWGALPSSTQHIVRHLAPGRRALWVNSLGLRRPKLCSADLGRAWRKGMDMFDSKPSTQTTAPFPILAPRAVPIPGNPLARIVNRRVLGAQVRHAANKAGIHKPVLWISLPTAVDVIGSLNERSVVYYCGDDFGALAGVDHEPVLRLEHELVQHADLILTASPSLAARFPATKTRVLPHGVDFEIFSRTKPRSPRLPVHGPIAGFYGSLADWLDIDMVAGIAEQLPNWQFLLIGPIRTDVSRLRELSNVHLLGPIPHQELPSFSQHWNAALLPFRDTAQIRACNPLKLREYLATGRPVVSTEFPALDGYRDLVSVADDPISFAQALQASLSEPSQRPRERKQRVARESWQVRAAEVAPLLEAL